MTINKLNETESIDVKLFGVVWDKLARKFLLKSLLYTGLFIGSSYMFSDSSYGVKSLFNGGFRTEDGFAKKSDLELYRMNSSKHDGWEKGTCLSHKPGNGVERTYWVYADSLGNLKLDLVEWTSERIVTDKNEITFQKNKHHKY